jgi:PAS domain S-box-containing protein
LLIIDLETGSILVANPAAASMHGYSLEALGELSMHDLILAKSLPLFADFAEVILQGGPFEMLTQHVQQDGSKISVEWRAEAMEYQGRTCALAVIRDVSKRVLAERQLQQQAGKRAQEQAALLEISQTLASTLELQPGLILDQIGVLVKYTHALLFTLEDLNLVAVAVCGKAQLEKALPFRIQVNGGQTVEALFNGQHPIRIADIWSPEISALSLRALLESDLAALLKGVHSWMWVPLSVKNRRIGGIGLAHARRNYFTPHHADLAMTIANLSAMTLVNAELHEHAQALAALQERQNLAQNLHDAINQSLFSGGLIAEVLPRLWERDPAEASRSLEDLRRLIRGAQAEMRALLAELRPTTLIDAELGDLLRLLGNAFTGRTNIPVAVTVSGKGSLPAETQVAIYRICQETLNNIAKHAKASQVEINVSYLPAGLKLNIHDNGCGFDSSQSPPSGHYGLGMMRERAEAVGATLSITSAPDQGTDIALSWERKDS